MSRFNYATTRNKSTEHYMPSQTMSETEKKIAFDAFIFVAKHSHILTQHNKEWLKKFITDIGHQFHNGKPVTMSQTKKLMQFEREIKQIQLRVNPAPKIKKKYLDILNSLGV
jgi:hypothetical protein